MYELKQIGKVFTSKFVGTGPSSYKKKNLPGRGLMYELKQIGKVFTSKFVGTGPSSCKKKNLPGRGLAKVEKHCCRCPSLWCTRKDTTKLLSKIRNVIIQYIMKVIFA